MSEHDPSRGPKRVPSRDADTMAPPVLAVLITVFSLSALFLIYRRASSWKSVVQHRSYPHNFIPSHGYLDTDYARGPMNGMKEAAVLIIMCYPGNINSCDLLPSSQPWVPLNFVCAALNYFLFMAIYSDIVEAF
ncbi:hypothetical protein AG1IA_00187 [Rhizoctonia solani AG-1 IA]|uniref:Uncharacterized protein n=1 Tax=Thanatephorus cucumeris (strain AG1-IA) TaxID=983506 RepID=L8XAU1_THACA|nr:hypothetical protein AG1IA_00187 [Rhizoctonia solani AG-1 IA]